MTCRMSRRLLLVDDTLAGAASPWRLCARSASPAGWSRSPAASARPRRRRCCGPILAAFGTTHAAVASYNNHWGLPLTLARMPPDAAFCVAEIGMNHAGEIAPLARLARPHVAVITAIEKAHIGYPRLDRGDRRRKGSDPARRWSRMASRCCRLTSRLLPRLLRAAGGAQIVTFGERECRRCAAGRCSRRTRTAAMSRPSCTASAARFG